MRPAALLLAMLLGSGCAALGGDVERVNVTTRHWAAGPRVLAVIAHPDDEVAFAATLYKLTTQLDGICDLFVITNGEGGFKYATLAERTYGLELTDEQVGRAELPRIRRQELADSARVLGVRRLLLLGEQDHRYTADVEEVLGPQAQVWDLARVRAELQGALAGERYDFVFALAPAEGTHAHHKAATALAAEAVLAVPVEQRPVMLVGTVRGTEGFSTLAFAPEELGVPTGPFVLDRRQRFGHQDKLDYRIVVNWAIAAHKSQGTLQLYANQGEREEYYLFGDRRIEASRKAAALFEALARTQFAQRSYGESAGTNAGARR